MESLAWEADRVTAQVATAYCPITQNRPARQFPGFRFDPRRWTHPFPQKLPWPAGLQESSPEAIIRYFRNEQYTHAAVLVVSWGAMGRTQNAVWKDHEPARVDAILRNCAINIRESNSIADAWQILTNRGARQLAWSDVMTSKTLHFMCRSLGFERNPAVPIDGQVMVKLVWPAFLTSSPRDLHPEHWRANGYGFAAYNRYMTAMLTWADQRQWSTTEVETTIYDAFK